MPTVKENLIAARKLITDHAPNKYGCIRAIKESIQTADDRFYVVDALKRSNRLLSLAQFDHLRPAEEHIRAFDCAIAEDAWAA